MRLFQPCLIALALIGCGSHPTPETQVSVSPSVQVTKTPQNQPDSFRDGVNKAMESAKLTQTAKTAKDWYAVVSAWKQAIDLMEAVPESSVNYKLAQQKSKEYQTNLNYAQRNVSARAIPDPPSHFSVTQVCKAGIDTVIGDNQSFTKISSQGEVVFLSYVRSADDTQWNYKCKIDGQRIIWGAEPGRWRTDPADEPLFFSAKGNTLEVEERYQDGSANKKTFTIAQLRK